MSRRSGRPVSILICILLVLGGLVLPVREADAAGDVVVSVCDEASLRHAISTAEDGSTITFSCSGTITLTSAGGGVILVEKNLTIDGSGQVVTISGGGSVSPFEVGFVGDLTLKHLTITGAGLGDNLTNDGKLTVLDSTISGGAAGIANWLGTTTVIRSTISGNNTGIQAHGGTVNVTNSTIGNNHTLSEGAGGIQIDTLAEVIVRYSTIANNSSSCGLRGGCPTGGQFVGGIYNYVGILTLQDTVLSGNLRDTIFSAGSPSNCLLGISFEFNDGGGNLSDDNTCGFNGTTSLNAVSALNLGPLAYNGGSTQTISLGDGSTAIDFASCDPSITTDQRGLPRPNTGGQGCDSGAFEFQDTVPSIATGLTAISGTGPYGGSATLSATLTAGGSGIEGQRIDFTLNGVDIGFAVTDSSGSATRSNVNIAGIGPVGVYAGAVGATFTGNAIYTGSSGSGSLTVTNIPPIVDVPTVNSNESSNEGQAVIAFADFISWDSAVAHSCTVDYGDGDGPHYGAVVQKPPPDYYSFVCVGLDHTYQDDGDYTVTVEVTVRGEESGSNSVAHLVNNVAPTIIDVSSDGPVDEGSTATITVTATDPAGAFDPLMYEFDCDNDGTYEVGPQAGNSASCSFADGGSFTVSIRVADDDGGSATGSTVVEVQDTAPAEITLLDEISGTGSFGGSATLSATLTADGNGVVGVSIDFTLNGADIGSATTDSSGIATLSNVSLTGVGASSYADAVGASFAGNSTFSSTSGSGTLAVAKADQTITVDLSAPAGASYGSTFTVAATASSGFLVSYDSSGACSNSGPTFTMTSGTCTVTFSQAGDGNYNAAISVEQMVTVAKAEQSISFDLSALSKLYGDSSFDISGYASASSGLPVGFSSTTPTICTVSGSMVSLLAAGTCTVSADQAGDDNFNPAPQVQQSFSVAKASLDVITNDATMTYGGAVPRFDPTVTGLVDGDTFSALGGTCSAQANGYPVTSATAAGTYRAAISCTGVDTANYAVSYAPGTLTVDPAVLTVTPDDQTVQYSDPLPVLTASYNGFVLGQDQSVLSGALSCTTAADVSGSGQVLSKAGAYSITCSGLLTENYQVSYQPGALTVTLEDTETRLGQKNPHAVQVDTSGSNKNKAPAMTFTARSAELSDGSYGDISLTTPVTLILDPVGGGGAISSTCTVTRVWPATSTDPGFELVSCAVLEGVPIDVYEVTMIVGGSYYQGSDTSVLTVYDPTAGGSNGAGTIINPDTGHAADISYSASYLKNGKRVQGKFLYVSRDADGNVVHILKGNVMRTMAINGATAKVTGKATLDGVGNYSYIITGIDDGASGDQYGQQVMDSAGSPVSALSFGPVDVGDGNIFVGNQ